MRLFVTNTPKNELFLGFKERVIPWLQKNEFSLASKERVTVGFG